MNWLAIFLAALSAFLVGGIWYSALFAKSWQRLAGVSDDQMKTGMAKIFIGSFVLSLIMSVNLGFFIGKESAIFGLGAGLAVGLGWVATSFGMNYLFERKPVGLFLINAGYNIVSYALMGFILGAF